MTACWFCVKYYISKNPNWNSFNKYLPAIAHKYQTIDHNGNTKWPSPTMICQHPPPFPLWLPVTLGQRIYPMTTIFPCSHKCNGNTKCPCRTIICRHPPPFLPWCPVSLSRRIYLTMKIFPWSCKTFDIVLTVPTFDQLHLTFTQSSLVWLQNQHWLLLIKNGSTQSQAGTVTWLWWNMERPV